MAFTAQGSRGSTSSKTVGTTLSMSPSSDVVAGQILAVWCVWDTGSTLHPQLTDSVGNVYVMIGWQSHGSIDLTALYMCLVQTTITTGDTITLTGSNLAAKAMSCEEFSYSGGAVKVARVVDFSALATLGADPGAITIGSLSSQEYLFLHLLGAEAPSTDTYTWDADYTQIAAAGTTGGVADTNVTILGGYRIATLTGDTVDVTSDTADRDYNQILTALVEVTPVAGFPQAPIVDTFTHADEDPLSEGGAWVSTVCTAGSSRFLRLVSNQAARNTVGNGGEWRTAQLLTANQELYITIATTTTTAGDSVGFQYAGTGCANTSTCTSAGAWWKPFQGGAFPGFDCVYLGISANTGGPSMSKDGIVVITSIASGDKLGIQATAKATHLYVDRGAGWVWVAAWYRDVDLGGSQKDGLTIFSSAARVDDYGAGDIPAPFLHLLPILGVGG